MRNTVALFLIFSQIIGTSSLIQPIDWIKNTNPLHLSPLTTNKSPLPRTKLCATESRESLWARDIGYSALETVKGLANSVSKANDASSETNLNELAEDNNSYYNPAPLYSTAEIDLLSNQTSDKSANERLVVSALAKLERDMAMLDNIAGERPQLSSLELSLLSLAVGVVATSPAIFPFKIVEGLAPAGAAFAASLGIGAEFVGKVAVADGKEVAAATLQCAAEAEGLLAQAERTKAILPLCVGIGATGASFCLLAPTFVESLTKGNAVLMTELFLLSPLVCILSAAVASLALIEVQSQTARAISVGNRRFARAGRVGRSWLSASEQIERNSINQSNKWKSFAWGVLPAPILGSIIPGNIGTKTVFVGAIAACQSAYYLAMAENTLARGQDAVSLKARSAAVCDSYANQGARSSAILPFTSALSSLCAAATAAVVELPLVEGLSHAGGLGILAQAGMVAFFPTLSSLFAAAASVSKARCQVDAEAATQAASTLALEYEKDPSIFTENKKDPLLRPIRGVAELIRCTTRSSWKSIITNTKVGRLILKPFFDRLIAIRTKLRTKRA